MFASLLTKRSLATLIKGQDAAKKIMSQVSQDLELLQKAGVKPKVVPVVVGNVAESRIYLDRKRAAALKAGLEFEEKIIPDTVDMPTMLKTIQDLNADPSVHGIIVQLPIPKHLDEQVVCNSVDVTKDVDGFTCRNLGNLVQGVGLGDSFVPCTPLAALKILQQIQQTEGIDFMGKNAVVAGRSHNVGLPIAMILQADHIKGGLDLTTTICHRYTPNEQLVEAVSKADVVVSAAGVPGLIKPEFVKPGAIVIDVGINRIKVDGKSKIVGDVHPDVAKVAGYMTPVPGGVGPCTVACLLYNTVIAARRQSQI